MVEVRVGQPPATLDGARFLGAGAFGGPTGFLLDVDAARFLVTGGCRILVEPKPSGSSRDLRGYLLGSAIGAICLQRGLLTLHANAILAGDGAVAFAGPARAGKSTLAGHFLGRGRAVLSDDVCAVTLDPDSGPRAWPGVARIKLWRDALLALGRQPEGLERVFDGEDKYSLPVLSASSCAPLRRIYILQSERVTGAPVVAPLSGRVAVEALLTNIYRWSYAGPFGVAGALFAQAVRLAEACEILSLRLPEDPSLYRFRNAELDRLLD